MRKRRKFEAAVRGLLLAVSTGIFLSGCGTEDRAVVFDPVFSETLTESKLPGGEMTELETGQEQEICVYVCGEVACPGVYELNAGSRIADALLLAGGFTENADITYVNLAGKITDGEKIYFPSKEETAGAGTLENAGKDTRVNINTADAALLETLPGIGVSKAGDIISYREEHGAFSKIEDVMNVPGIKEAAFSKIRDLIKTE